MNATATTDAPDATAADTVVVGVFEDEGVAHDLEGGPLDALLDSGEAKRQLQPPGGRARRGQALDRWSGSAPATSSTPSAPASPPPSAYGRAVELGTEVALLGGPAPRRRRRRRRRWSRARCWPPTGSTATRRSATRSPRGHERAAGQRPPRRLAGAVDRAAVLGDGRQRRARPPEHARQRPDADRAGRARRRRSTASRSRSRGREEIEARGMGAFAARRARQRRGAAADHACATSPRTRRGPHLALVGKAVTFDSGGISIKPGDEDGGDEVRHVGRRRRARAIARDRPARACRCA